MDFSAACDLPSRSLLRLIFFNQYSALQHREEGAANFLRAEGLAIEKNVTAGGLVTFGHGEKK
jgi:hypothetical protein